MSHPDITPPLFDINPPYAEMDGKKIRVTSRSAASIGGLVTYHRADEKKFGVRIDILHPIVHQPHSEPLPLGKWVDVGMIPVTSLWLSKEQILRIQKVDADDYAFDLELEWSGELNVLASGEC